MSFIKHILIVKKNSSNKFFIVVQQNPVLSFLVRSEFRCTKIVKDIWYYFIVTSRDVTPLTRQLFTSEGLTLNRGWGGGDNCNSTFSKNDNLFL
jgi:hypothetical protein